MTEPTERFTGLAEIYSSARPGYPAEAIDYIFQKCGLVKGSRVADIGCGTGISSRLFAARDVTVIGIEPNDDMRKQAVLDSVSSNTDFENPTYRRGGAEDTGLSTHSVKLILAAQAFHWFRPDQAIAEFCRVVQPDGWIALMWNERDPEDLFTREYGTLLESFPDTKGVELNRAKSGNSLLKSNAVTCASVTYFANQQEMDLQGLMRRAFSSSYVPKKSPGKEILETGLLELFERYQNMEKVTLHYKTSVYLAQPIDSARS